MSLKTEVLIWPLKVSTAPARWLGGQMLSFLSSKQVKERREFQDAQDLELRNFQTAVILAQTVGSRLANDSSLDNEQRDLLSKELYEAYCDIGTRVVRAASDENYASAIGLPSELTPALES